MTADPVFEVDSVGYGYPGGQVALAGVSARILPGESVALLGANASGKSTLLKLLDGLYFPSQGQVKAFGTPLTEQVMERGEFARSFRRRVGYLFQNTDAMLFSGTVEEELAFGPLQLRLEPEEVGRRVEDVLTLLDLQPLRNRPPHRLSEGEKKRVALGALLTAGPSVLLLDEPTTGLDPRTQQWLVDFLRDLRQTGLTVILATHDLSFAPEVADRALVLTESHELAADGDLRAVLADLDLLLRVNLIHAHTHRHDGGEHEHPHLHGTGHEHQHGYQQ